MSPFSITVSAPGFSWSSAAALLLAFSCATALVWTTAFDQFSIIFFFLAFGALGIFLTGPSTRAYFMLAYACNVLFSLAWAWYQMESGKGFFFFSDEQTFYDVSRTMAESVLRGSAFRMPRYIEFPGFFYMNASILLFAERLGDMTPVVLRLANSFAGAMIAPAVYHLAHRFEGGGKHSLAHQCALLCALFPVFIYFSGLGLRDIWVACLTTWILRFMVIRQEGRSGWLGYLAIALLISGIALLRTFSLLPIAVLFGYLLMFSRNRPFNVIAKGAILVSFPIAVAWVFKSLQISLMLDLYKAQLLEHSSSGSSLGAAFLRLPPGIKQVVLFIYTLFFPVPPFNKLIPINLFVGIGNTLWYVVVPLSILGMAAALKREKENVKLCQGLILMAFTTILGVSLVSIDLRHKLQAYPIAIIFCVYALHHADRLRIRQVLLAMALISANLIPLYLMLKMT